MKSNLFKNSLLLAVVLGMAMSFSFKEKVDFSKYQMNDLELCYNVPTEEEAKLLPSNEPSYYLFTGKSLVGFKEALGFKESRGNYSIINKYGYLGKYQFGKSALKAVGIHDYSDFIDDSYLQEKAFCALASRNKGRLAYYIGAYEGKHVGGVKITESGILAAAHLGGVGNVKKYLRSGGSSVFKDAFGTSIRYYLKKFSGYDTSFIIGDVKAKV